LYQDTEVRRIEEKSRADYFKERRKSKKAFYVELDKKKVESLEVKLKGQNKTKTVWLEEKIDEELEK